MKLEDQVTSLEPSNRLRELGVKQESLHWWYQEKGDSYSLNSKHYLVFDLKISAFTVAELGEMLPSHTASYFAPEYEVDINEDDEPWCCIKYVPGEHSKYEYVFYQLTEADARAKMLIYLIENKLIQLPSNPN